MFPFSSKETTRESVLFGVIGSYISQDVSHLEDTFRRGIRVWRICVPWDLYGPMEGFFDSEYVRKTEAYTRKITESGLNVEVQLSFQNPPPWVFAYPGSRFRDQYGDEWIQEPSFGKNTAARANEEWLWEDPSRIEAFENEIKEWISYESVDFQVINGHHVIAHYLLSHCVSAMVTRSRFS